MGIRVLLADDHRLVREGLRRTLAEAGLEVVGEAQDGDEAQQLAVRLLPDVVLMDITMPGPDGITVTRRLSRRTPETRVVILTMHEDRDLLERADAAGAVGYLVKDAAGTEVVEAVRRAHEGGRGASPSLGGASAGALGWRAAGTGTKDPEPGPVLSDRERQILQLLADGKRPNEVADHLVISPKTVRNHLVNIYAKLEVNDRAQAIVVGLRHGLIELPEA